MKLHSYKYALPILVFLLILISTIKTEILAILTCLILFTIIWFGYFLFSKRQQKFYLFNPVNIMAVSIVSIFFVKSIYILRQGWFGSSLKYSYILDSQTTGLVIKALMLITLGFFVFVIFVGISTNYFRHHNARIESTDCDLRRFYPILIVTFLATCSSYYFIYGRVEINQISDIWYFMGMKQQVFMNIGYLIPFTLMFKASFLLWTAYLFQQHRLNYSWLVIWMLSIVFDLLSGSRSNILFGNVLIVIALYFLIYRKEISTVKIGISILLLLIFASTSYRYYTRDIYFGTDEDFSISGIVNTTYRSYDLTALDNFVIAIDSVPEQIQLQYGKTWASILLWPLPNAILGEKPKGGNQIFTRQIYPEYYYPNQIEMSVSVFGDSYINLGWIGIPFICSILGIFSGFLYMKRDTIIGTVVYLIYFFRFPSIIRGDFYNGAINLIMFFTVICVCYYSWRYSCNLKRPRRALKYKIDTVSNCSK